MTMHSFAAVLLAAGLSTRHKNGHKLTRVWRGKPLIQHSLDTLRSLQLSQLVVVLGNNAGEIYDVTELSGITVVRNSRPELGLSQSLRLGVEALDKPVAASFISLADMPLVEAGTYTKLASCFAPDKGKTICVPDYGGRIANPVLFGRRWFPQIAGITGDKGARAIINAERESVASVVTENDGVVTDFDLDGDFDRE